MSRAKVVGSSGQDGVRDLFALAVAVVEEDTAEAPCREGENHCCKNMPSLSPTSSEARSRVTREQAPPTYGECRSGIMPYVILAIVTLFAHGVLMANQGTIWDSWYVLEWLKAKNFAPMREFFGSVGIPSYALLYQPFAFFADIPAAFMFATFVCLLAGSILTYHLMLRVSPLGRGEALGIAALAQAMPVFNAAQDFIMFFFIFTSTVFLLATLCVIRAMDVSGGRRWCWMGLGILGFWFSFANAALLVFYGGFYLLLFIRFGRPPGSSIVPAAWKFLRQHPVLFLLPPANWLARPWLTPQYGWYAHYNSPIANVGNLGTNLWSFFQNVPVFHVRKSIEWATVHPWFVVLLVAVAVCWWIAAPRRWNFEPGNVATRHLVWSGSLLLFLAIFPFAAAGKRFSAIPVGGNSHHFFLVGLPVAILLYAVIRCAICWRHRAQFGRIITPLVGCSVVFLGGQLSHYYVMEQEEWVFSRALLHQAARNEVVRGSSILLVRGFSSFMRQPAYAICGFATAFGELSRCVLATPPEDAGRFFTPSEIERKLLRTTFLPNEFKNVNPAGQQALVDPRRKGGTATPWDIVRRYQMLRWFGTGKQMEDYLASLCSLEAVVLRPGAPLDVAPARAWGGAREAHSGIPDGDFSNGAGMQMVLLSTGWWAGRFEVTQAEYEHVMGANPSLFKDPSRPVECVTWNEATEFCRRLTDSERRAGRIPSGFIYRLPTVKEFDQLFAYNSLRDSVTAAREIHWHTAPVGSKSANSLGLHDVLGNVWEWCLDWGDAGQRMKVSAGGSWVNYAWELAPYTGSREGMGTDELTAFERLCGPLRKDYPDQGFWDRGFRCLMARPAPDSTSPMPGVASSTPAAE